MSVAIEKERGKVGFYITGTGHGGVTGYDKDRPHRVIETDVLIEYGSLETWGIEPEKVYMLTKCVGENVVEIREFIVLPHGQPNIVPHGQSDYDNPISRKKIKHEGTVKTIIESIVPKCESMFQDREIIDNRYGIKIEGLEDILFGSQPRALN